MIPAVVLAGGASRRMGTEKALLRWGEGTLVEAVLARIAPQAGPLAINANGDPARFAALGRPVLPDPVGGQPGPLAGVLAALDWAAGVGATAVLTVPCDAPHLPLDLVTRLDDGVLARPALAAAGGRLHPTCAIWPVAARGAVAAMLGAGVRALAEAALLLDARVVRFDDEEAFANVNAPEDAARLSPRLAGAEPQGGRLFDRAIAVDWSASSTPSPARESPDAIWIAEAVPGAEPVPTYHRTRAGALADLRARLAAPGRAIVGIDIALGYPAGVAAGLTGEPRALAVWDWLAARIEDGPDNANNRFAVAAEMNRALGGGGPFWGWRAAPEPDLPTGGRSARNPYATRATEARLRGAKSPFQLTGAGAVGSQTLLALPHLARLRREVPLAVWPEETGWRLPVTGHVLVELYVSIWSAGWAADPVRDRAQVIDAARRLLAATQGDFAPPADLPDAARIGMEEGWIWGVP